MQILQERKREVEQDLNQEVPREKVRQLLPQQPVLAGSNRPQQPVLAGSNRINLMLFGIKLMRETWALCAHERCKSEVV